MARRNPASLNSGSFFPERDGDLRGFFAAAFADCQQQLQQPILHLRTEPADHAKVDERQQALVGDEDVAGMRIGVKHAVDDDLLQIRAHQRVGEHIALEIDPDDGLISRDLGAAT
jgi:hypothetical protein